MRKLYSLFLILLLALSIALPAVASAAAEPEEPYSAIATNNAIVINSADASDAQPVHPAVYKIEGANYFKLRDIAMLLNGSERQFAVDSDDNAKAVSITSGKPYMEIGSELSDTATASRSAIMSNNTISINGSFTDMSVFKIDGANYFRLRDLGKALDFYVGYDDETKTVYISGSKGYEEEDNTPYTYNVAFANWTDDSRIYSGALNCRTMTVSSVHRLPIYKFDTEAELDAFKASYSEILTMDQGLDETPSFDCITAAYNDSFFSKYSLLLVYVPASSSSYRFGVSDVVTDDQSFCVYIERLNDPEAYNDMMAGWFAAVEVDKEDIEKCVDFDAQLRHASAGGGIVVTENIRADVCALYLKVLEDLWNVDSGINGGISQVGIDLSKLSHLTEAEKGTVISEFASRHNLPYIAGTWEKLCELGYIDKDNLHWKDGLFFSIKTNENAEWNLPAIKEGDSVPELTAFDAQKWRNGLGAYYFGQCTAQKNADGTWSYTVGQEAIS